MIIKYKTPSKQTRFLVEFSLDGTRYRKKGFETKAEALHWQDAERTRIRSGGMKVDRRTTLGDYLDWWHGSFRITNPGDGEIYKRRSGRTYRFANHKRNEQHIEKIKKTLGDIKLARLDADHGHKLEQVFRKTDINPTGVAASSIRAMQFMLRGALSDGVKEKKLDCNPLQNMVIADKDQQKLKPHAFDNADAQKVLDNVLKLDDRRWSMFFILALKTGMRKGEIAALTWEDIRLDEQVNYVQVNKSIDWSRGDNKPRVKLPKTIQSIRKVPITADTARELKLYRAWQSQKWLEFGAEFNDETILFFNDSLGLISKSVPQHRWEKVIRQSGVKKLSLHKARHTFATFTLKHTRDIRLVSKLLGHSNVKTTEIYLDEKQDLEREAEMLAEMERKYQRGDWGGDAYQKL